VLRIPGTLVQRFVQILHVSRFIGAPLIVGGAAGGQVIGLFAVESPDLTEADIPTITAFAHQMAAAWHRAQLYEQAQHEIAERQRANQALRESEERLKLVIEATSDGVWDLNFQTGAAYFSPRYCTMLGYQPDELPSTMGTWINLLHPEDAEDALRTVTEHLQGNRPGFEIEMRMRTKAGDWRWILDRGKVVEWDEHGTAIRMVGVHVDISERKRNEEERERLLAQIQAHAQRVQQIVDTVPEGVVLLDADGRVVLTNPQGRKDLAVLVGSAVVGSVLTELGGRPLADLLAPPPTDLWHEVTAEDRIYQIIARSVETDPQPSGWVVVIRDVTREREVEQHIQQQERLAAVGQMAAGIAHDCNNIMATIVLYAQMLALEDGMSAPNRDRLTTIHQQAMHATNLVQQILDFSRRAVLDRRLLNLADLLAEQIQILRRILPESIEVTLAHRPGEYIIHADPTRIQQAVLNLALNARDAMTGGGRLNIRLERVADAEAVLAHFPEVETGDWIRLTVSDDGIGIPPDALPHIFEPFFTTKAPGQGSGLGLPQVYGIIGQHNGFIDVVSHMGAGTTFAIYLPAALPEVEEIEEADVPELIGGHGQTILVVEDNDVARTALVDSLEFLSYRTLEAANGNEALKMVEQHGAEIALVLSDVVMPGMDGFTLLRILRECQPGIAVVLMTGHPLKEQLEDLQAQGVAMWLPKPVDLDRLAQIVAEGLCSSSN
jgi:PAS domain S-box-containing protein